MLRELESRIKKVEDIEEIKNLEARFIYLVDTNQMDKIPDLFADSFVVDFGHAATFTTKPELLEFMKGSAARYSLICHQETNPYIELDGDKATGTWYLLALTAHVTPQGEVAAWLQGRCDNEYVRVDGKWKFSCRRVAVNLHSPYDDGWVRDPADAGMRGGRP